MTPPGLPRAFGRPASPQMLPGNRDTPQRIDAARGSFSDPPHLRLGKKQTVCRRVEKMRSRIILTMTANTLARPGWWAPEGEMKPQDQIAA